MDFRREWLEAVIGTCQAFTGHVMALDNTDELLPSAMSWIDSVPDPISRAEDLALRGILCDVAVRWSALAHDRIHPDARRRCGFVTTHGLDCFGARDQRPAKSLFEDWARMFSHELIRTHPPSSAQRVEAIIRKAGAARCDVARLARLVGVPPARLREEFRRERGLALPEYVRRVRLLRTLEILKAHGGKIEPLALEAGYRSKKNFYRSFRQLTSLTPVQFRRLDPDAAHHIIEGIRVGLLAARRSR